MKYQEIVKLTTKELETKIEQEKDMLRKLKLTHKINPLENPMRIRHTRRLIAQLKTAQKIEAKTLPEKKEKNKS